MSGSTNMSPLYIHTAGADSQRMRYWVKAVFPMIGGKGGGSNVSSQASGPLVNKVQEAIQAAREFSSHTFDASPFSIINMHKYFCPHCRIILCIFDQKSCSKLYRHAVHGSR